MSGDNHNQADPLDLDAIERSATGAGAYARPADVLALVAEVRRRRAQVARVNQLPHRSAWFEGANGMPAGHPRDVVSYDRLRAVLDADDPA